MRPKNSGIDVLQSAGTNEIIRVYEIMFAFPMCIYIFKKNCCVTSFLLSYIFYLFIYFFYYFFIDLHLLPAVDSDIEFKVYFRTRNYYHEKLGLLCRMYLSFSETGKDVYKMKNTIILYF